MRPLLCKAHQVRPARAGVLQLQALPPRVPPEREPEQRVPTYRPLRGREKARGGSHFDVGRQHHAAELLRRHHCYSRETLPLYHIPSSSILYALDLQLRHPNPLPRTFRLVVPPLAAPPRRPHPPHRPLLPRPQPFPPALLPAGPHAHPLLLPLVPARRPRVLVRHPRRRRPVPAVRLPGAHPRGEAQALGRLLPAQRAVRAGGADGAGRGSAGAAGHRRADDAVSEFGGYAAREHVARDGGAASVSVAAAFERDGGVFQ